MLIYCLVIASILIQLTTAFLALRLITLTEKQLSWIFIAIAIVVQASRRTYILSGLISGKIISSQVGPSELIGLFVSVLMFAGVISFGSFLTKSSRSIRERKKAEELLAESEDEFRTLAESMPQIVWATRADVWNIYFNQQWIDYTGMTLEESYGHGWNKPFHPDDQQVALDAWQNAVNTAVRNASAKRYPKSE